MLLLVPEFLHSFQEPFSVYLNANGSLVSMNTYNALGQRVEDISQTLVNGVWQSQTTDEAYGAGGNLLLRYPGDSNSRSFIPFNGRLLAEYYCGGMIFEHPDEIGSATTATDCAGNVVQERLYYPFGEFWTGFGGTASAGMHPVFAQLPDYDPETDQYNTANRHYSPSGRWLSPDPNNAGADPRDPQTWNMYAYVRNNPLNGTDPDGLGVMDWLQKLKDWSEEFTNWSYGFGAVTNSQLTPAQLNKKADLSKKRSNAIWLAIAAGFQQMDANSTSMGGAEEEEAPSTPRLPQDEEVDPVAPRANGGDGTVGPNANQNAQAQADAEAARAQGATDIRMNQQQVNADGTRVGINRPDLQYTLNGKRYHIEYESSNPGAGPAHEARSSANDPNVIVIIKHVN